MATHAIQSVFTTPKQARRKLSIFLGKKGRTFNATGQFSLVCSAHYIHDTEHVVMACEHVLTSSLRLVRRVNCV